MKQTFFSGFTQISQSQQKYQLNAQWNPVTSIDTKSRIVYLIGVYANNGNNPNVLIGFSLSSGQASSISLSNTQTWFGSATFDMNSGLIYGVRFGKKNNHFSSFFFFILSSLISL
jgi:hypothetical protein